MIEAITFDAGGTLIDPWPSVGHVYAAVASEHGYPGLSAELLELRFGRAWQAREQFAHSRAEWAQVVDQTFDGLIDPPPSRTFFPVLYGRFARSDAWRIYPDVWPMLEAGRRHGLRLGVVSNWDERLAPLLDSLALAPWFDSVIVSWDVGALKPDRLIFDRAAEALAVPPERILHVGDSYREDVLGARAAGFRAVRIDRLQAASPGERIQSLAELVRLIRL